MTTKTRREFTDEFKQEAVSLLEDSGRPHSLDQLAAAP
jgi:transposase-like protein